MDAGRKIWISKGLVNRDVFYIEECFRADSLPGSGKERNQCLKALCNFIKDAGFSVFGMDFPFGLPVNVVSEKSWTDFIKLFHIKYPGEQEFRNKCRLISGGLEIRRVTDKECKTPFSPYNLRIYRQTYYGICNLLAPLVQNNAACVLPMQKVKNGKPLIMEVCPASTLKQKNLYLHYKGSSKKHYTARDYILKLIGKELECQINANEVKSIALRDSNGDALDSIIAAIAAFSAIRYKNHIVVNKKSVYSIEGYVYV